LHQRLVCGGVHVYVTGRFAHLGEADSSEPRLSGTQNPEPGGGTHWYCSSFRASSRVWSETHTGTRLAQPRPIPNSSPASVDNSVAGPTLASRYLIPALVDCLGRLVTTAAAASARPAKGAAAAHSPHDTTRARESFARRRSVSDSATAAPAQPAPPALPLPLPPAGKESSPDGRVDGSAEHKRPTSLPDDDDDDEDVCCRGGDPASAALLRYCRTRGATEEYPDAGIGEGTSLLVLSQALGDVCLEVSCSGCRGELVFFPVAPVIILPGS